MEGGEYEEHVFKNPENRSKETINATVNHSSGDHALMNGMSNGYTEKHKKDKHKHKHREKDRDSDREKHRDKHKDHKDRDKEKDRDRDRDREKDKHKHGSSSSSSKDKEKDRDKDRHSSSSSKDKDRDRDRDKERKDKDGKHRDDKERRPDKDKESKSSSSSSNKEHKSSSSSKHSSSSSSLKPSSSSSSSKDKDKHNSSSSKDKEKDRHSSDKDKYKDRDKDRHSSSSSKDKERHRDSSEKKHKDKHKEKEIKEEKYDKDSYEKDGYESQSHDPEKSWVEDQIEAPPVKEEPVMGERSYEDEYDDDDDGEGELTIKEEPLDETEEGYDQSTTIKTEDDSDDDVPLVSRSSNIKREHESDDDDVPLVQRKKIKKEGKKRKMEESEDDDCKPEKKKPSKEKTKIKKEKIEVTTESPKKKKKKEEETQEVWKWWEEEKKGDKVKWTFLEHKGPVFAPLYERLPPNVKFFYDGKEMQLSEEAEEVATFYARMLDHDYTTKEAFNTNFFKDWRKVMTNKEREKITDLSKCNFKQMHAYFIQKSEERKAMSKEEKKELKEKNEQLAKEYGFCAIDGHKEKIGNFKIEPPGLFRGRGEHPKMGMLKRRVLAEDVIINCSKDSKIPVPPEGHKWKEVRHDNTVTWLASWTENVQGQVKYVMLNPSSKLKGEKDWQKYETARKLAKCIDQIRENYRTDWKSKEMRIRQRAVALYFIDKLALRAGNEKDEDQADTVGCCSLRVEHIALHEERDGREYVVVFDFPGKDSIRYYNEVPVEKRVFKNLQLFIENKKGSDDLFDRLNTAVLNKHLNELMEGLTAKVFRTYNASSTLQAQLKELTDPDTTVAEKILSYNRANRAVAILCNHQRSIPKSHAKSMENLKEKLNNKRAAVAEAEKNYKYAKKEAKNGSAKEQILMEKAKKTLDRLKEQLVKLEVQETDKEENKTIALSTSKLNYLDPRISVAWCKKYDVPIEKIYNRTQRDKFRWAIDMAGPDYEF